ncbi:hypothetical protein J2X69_005027 [Algoriphagus sp. 4150]|uniref:DNA-binding protein n=1 Tax=Algoriphagus sp. 4150 TaxID=2817756 RepID=UPI002862091F|nr:DNA-binding protein [Algoriphagus sp. 4150]MDR7132653.1 hypothetical protein [Algoriphagus sp. 4150]
MEPITKEDLEALRFQLFADLKELLAKKDESQSDKKEWLRSRDVKKMLSISDAALQNLRIRGVVHPVKISGLYYYKSEELKSLFRQ